MPTDAKRAAVADMVQLFSTSDRAIVSDYRGLSVADLGALRASLREHGITFRVVKNRLAKIAAEQAGRSDLASLLEGPSAVVVGGDDEVRLARALLDAIRPYRTVAVRGGIIAGSRVDTDGLTRLATLPGRDQLLAQLAGGMVAPLATLASLLAAPLRNLAYAMAQVRDQREQSGPPEPVVAGGPGSEAADTTAPDEPATTTAPDEPAAATADEPAAATADEPADTESPDPAET